MDQITILELLTRYQARLKSGDVQFLKVGSDEEEKISDLLGKLITRIADATEKEGGLSQNLDMHDTHKLGLKLWRELTSTALNNIDPDSKGNSALFEFIDSATKFEDLLYGLERYYRDHTLHSLWVYFLGDHILKDITPNIYKQLNWYLFNDVLADESAKREPREDSIKKESKICSLVNEKKDAIWCVMALCHDLGYSLSKLDDLNKRVKEVLKFFDMLSFQRIGYAFDIEQHFLFSQFLELMAIEVRIIRSADNTDAVIKCYRDDSTYWRLCRATEKKQHGIFSSYLIYKLLGIFADTSVRGPAEEWGLEPDEAVDNIIRGDILFGIAQHEFEYSHLYELSSLADVLKLADDLEEFSRFGRELLARKYYDTTAEASLIIKPENPKPGDDLEITTNYYFAKDRTIGDFKSFFARKAIGICKTYSLDQTYEYPQMCHIKTYCMNAIFDEDTKYSFQLSNDPNETKGMLPETTYKGHTYPESEYRLLCHDDDILVKIDGQKVPLKTWLGIDD